MFLSCWYLWTYVINVIFETPFIEVVVWKIDQLVPESKLNCLFNWKYLSCFSRFSHGCEFHVLSYSFISAFAEINISCIHWPSQWLVSRLTHYLRWCNWSDFLTRWMICCHHRAKGHCLSRRILTGLRLLTSSIIICTSRTSRLWLVNKFSFRNTWASSQISTAVSQMVECVK